MNKQIKGHGIHIYDMATYMHVFERVLLRYTASAYPFGIFNLSYTIVTFDLINKYSRLCYNVIHYIRYIRLYNYVYHSSDTFAKQRKLPRLDILNEAINHLPVSDLVLNLYDFAIFLVELFPLTEDKLDPVLC